MPSGDEQANRVFGDAAEAAVTTTPVPASAITTHLVFIPATQLVMIMIKRL